MSGFTSLKKATGLTGLAVVKNPQHSLSVLYSKILRTLAKMPGDSAYRKYTEEIVTTRAALASSATSVEDLEKKIDCGQAEEIIIQAENELVLARKMLVWKPWEPLATKAPPNQWTWPPK